MHPWLEDLSLFTLYLVFDSEEKCATFFTDMGLIPSKSGQAPDCPICGVPTSVQDKPGSEFGWEWACQNSDPDKCDVTINPAENTLFEDKKLSLQDILVLLYFFVVKQPIQSVIEELTRTKLYFGQPEVHKDDILEYFSIFREVCEVHASYIVASLGGVNRSGRLDKVFLSRRKYHFDKAFDKGPLVILGIYCQEGIENKEGVFLEFDDPDKPNLLPIIQEYYHPGTRLIHFNDEQKKALVPEASDPESRNPKRRRVGRKPKEEELLYRHLEQTASQQISAFQQYMAINVYRRNRFLGKNVCQHVECFLFDVRAVYPGSLSQGLRLRKLSELTSNESISDDSPDGCGVLNVFDFDIVESEFAW